jgi:hypothetical protein
MSEQKTTTTMVSYKKKSRRPNPRTRAKALTSSTWSILSQNKPYSIPPVPINRSYRIVQNVDYGTWITTSLTLNTFASQVFTLNDLAQVATLSALFDQYKIEAITCWVKPELSVATAQIPVDYATCIDLDDATVPAAYTTVEEFQTCVSSPLTLGHCHKFRPHIAVAAYSGAFTSFKNDPSTWIDVASPGVQHFGLKGACLTTGMSVTSIHLSARFQIAFRNVR